MRIQDLMLKTLNDFLENTFYFYDWMIEIKILENGWGNGDNFF